MHEKKQKGSEAWHAGERTKPGLAAQRVGWIEYSPGPAKGEIEVSSTLLMERSCASQPRQSKNFVEKAMEDKKSTRLCDGTPHGAAVSNFLGCSKHQQRLCRRPRCLRSDGTGPILKLSTGILNFATSGIPQGNLSATVSCVISEVGIGDLTIQHSY